MKINGHIANDEKAAFFDGFFEEFGKFPFGSMPKRDLECLIIYLLRENGMIEGNNGAMANSLGINESRLKGYIIDSRYKYQQDKQQENIQKIIADITDGSIKPQYEDGLFTFVLEDPVLRLDFSRTLKDMGHFDDTSFNHELVKIKDYVFFAFLMENQEEETKKGLFKAIADKTALPEKELQKNISKNTPLIEKSKKFLQNIIDSGKNITPADILGILITVF